MGGKGSETYRVTVTPTGPGPPGEIRLRRFLKALLRSAGLRAVKVEEVPAAPPAGPGDARGLTPPPAGR
jgi:hypothetical protein